MQYAGLCPPSRTQFNFYLCMFCCFSKTSTEVMPATSETASQQEAAHRSAPAAALTSAELSPSALSASAFTESR